MNDRVIRAGIDVLAGGAVAGTIVGWLPTISAFLGAIWFVVQISESQRFAQFTAWIRRKLGRSNASTP